MFIFRPIAGHLASSLMVIVGTGVRIVILAEVLGTTEGIGYALSLSRTKSRYPGFVRMDSDLYRPCRNH